MTRTTLAQSLPAPMLPTLVEKPFDSRDWVFETKWDGVRAICAVTRQQVMAVSRTGRDLLSQFPELSKLRSAFKTLPVVIDGEITSVNFVVIDLLVMGAQDIREEPLEHRKALLKKSVRAGNAFVIFSEHVAGDGVKLFQRARRRGLEGIVAKRRDSPYRTGRSRDWLKIKVIESQEFVICGWTEPAGSRRYFGALLLGVYDRGELTYAGHAGTGFDERTLAALHEKLARIETKRSPFRIVPKVNAPVHWVTPKLVAEVKFGEWTRDGVLRQPVYVGLRVDKKPKECVRTRP
jgi:bifunctional non-homologous end joining protein LigD